MSFSGWRAWPVGVLTASIRAYQLLLSPMLGQNCRFEPSCSQYALEALRIHGAWRGMVWSVRRVMRCHPWHPGGVDPVPPAGAPFRVFRRWR